MLLTKVFLFDIFSLSSSGQNNEKIFVDFTLKITIRYVNTFKRTYYFAKI